jgi:hypothetical protein
MWTARTAGFTAGNCVLYCFNSEFTKKINKITSKLNKNASFVCDFVDNICKFTVKIIQHTGASYKTSDFTWKFLAVLIFVINLKFLELKDYSSITLYL